MTGLMAGCKDRLMNKRFDRWDQSSTNGLLVGRMAERRDS